MNIVHFSTFWACPGIRSIDEYEQGILINALNLLRNKQIRECRPTDPIDDLIMKIIEQGPRNLMVAERGESYEYAISFYTLLQYAYTFVCLEPLDYSET